MFGTILPQGDILEREDSVDGISTPVGGVHSYHGTRCHGIHHQTILRPTLLFSSVGSPNLTLLPGTPQPFLCSASLSLAVQKIMHHTQIPYT